MKYLVLVIAAMILSIYKVAGEGQLGDIFWFVADIVFCIDLMLIATDWVYKIQSRLETASRAVSVLF